MKGLIHLYCVATHRIGCLARYVSAGSTSTVVVNIY